MTEREAAAHWERRAYNEALEAKKLRARLAAVEAVLNGGPVDPDTAGGIPFTGFALDAFDAGVDAVKALVGAALREEDGDR